MNPLHNKLRSSLVRKVGIDLGADFIRMRVSRAEADGFAEPALIAVDQNSQRVLAVGSDAALMEGRVSQYITIHHPFLRSVVYDADVALALLKVVWEKINRPGFQLNTIIMVSVPAGCTQAERDNVTQLMYRLGAAEVYTIAEPLAAAIGAGVPIADASGSFFLHLGASRVEGAVISLGSIVGFESIEYAGSYLVDRIAYLVKVKFGLKISRSVAQKLLHQVAFVEGMKSELLVAGQDLQSRSPKELTITTSDLEPEIMKAADRYRLLLERLLTQIEPELTVDVIDKGLLLSGGFSQLGGLDRYLTKTIGTAVSLVDDPENVAIKGIMTALEHLDLFKQSLGYQAG